MEGRPEALTLSPIIQTEAEVLRDVRRYLLAHPKVRRLIRINSGVARIGEDEERQRFIRFCEIEGQAALRAVSKRGGAVGRLADEQTERVPDLIGFLVDGRFLAVEAKRGGWRRPSTPRERAQARFLSVVRTCGGVAGFCASLRDAERLLMDA